MKEVIELVDKTIKTITNTLKDIKENKSIMRSEMKNSTGWD